LKAGTNITCIPVPPRREHSCDDILADYDKLYQCITEKSTDGRPGDNALFRSRLTPSTLRYYSWRQNHRSSRQSSTI